MNRRAQHGQAKPRPRYQPAARASSYDRGYDLRWRKFARWYLLNHPWCVGTGCDRPANEVDHITPMSDGGAQYDPSNLQALCKNCHSRKTTDDIKKRKLSSK